MPGIVCVSMILWMITDASDMLHNMLERFLLLDLLHLYLEAFIF